MGKTMGHRLKFDDFKSKYCGDPALKTVRHYSLLNSPILTVLFVGFRRKSEGALVAAYTAISRRCTTASFRLLSPAYPKRLHV